MSLSLQHEYMSDERTTRYVFKADSKASTQKRPVKLRSTLEYSPWRRLMLQGKLENAMEKPVEFKSRYTYVYCIHSTVSSPWLCHTCWCPQVYKVHIHAFSLRKCHLESFGRRWRIAGSSGETARRLATKPPSIFDFVPPPPPQEPPDVPFHHSGRPPDRVSSVPLSRRRVPPPPPAPAPFNPLLDHNSMLAGAYSHYDRLGYRATSPLARRRGEWWW